MASTEPKRRGERRARTAHSTVFPRQRRDEARGAEDFDILAPTGSQPVQPPSRRSCRPAEAGGTPSAYKKTGEARSRRAIPAAEAEPPVPQGRLARLWEQFKDGMSPKRIMAMEKTIPDIKPVINPATTGDARGIHMLKSPLWCYHGFIGAVLFLTFLGAVMVFSSSAISNISSGKSPWSQAFTQGKFCLIGLAFCFGASRIKAPAYRRFSGIILLIAWAFQLLTMSPLGVNYQGNTGWVNLGIVTMQPAEFMKLAVCLWMPLGVVIASQRSVGKDHWPYALPVIMLMLCCMLVILGRDMGTDMIILIIGVVVLLLGGMPMSWFGVMGAAVVALGALLVIQSPNRLDRVLSAYTKCNTAQLQGTCYQSVHAKFALASGGFAGVGLGNSREKWNYLPEAHNDFIFAIIGEELGYVGAIIIVLMFLLIGWCLACIALQSKDRYTSIVLISIAVWIVGQALVNIMVVIGLLPVMGVPMPFVSAGGSSLIMCLTAAGVAMSMMRQETQIATATNRLNS
ncbi:putative peptidoglycan glycosyltransferase FtsW [Bifidobacterium apri]|uniref:peptidoglycan glycosyltransferase FtsW n=1 Tax=Bifidobacterium apri TaxID=1769423 RepID=UPI00399303B5